MNAKRNKVLTLGTLAGSLALSGAAFAVTPMTHGYMGDAARQAEGGCGAKSAEAKCGAKSDASKKHGEGRCGMKAMDKNGDGKLSKDEFAAAHDGKTDKFAAHDLDGDGFITQAEMDKAHAMMKKDKAKSGEGKCGEGKCGEGKCGGSRK